MAVKPFRHTQEMMERYIEQGYWGRPSIADLWDHNAKRYPDKEAVADSQTRMTWSQAKRWIDRVALGLLEMGIQKDEIKEVPPGEIGEIVVRGAVATSGYFRDPETTRQVWGEEADGWFHMGDLGKWDAHGNLYVVGRKKDMIIRGGQNIIPGEIENMLIAHPRVFNVAIVAMPDPVMGEKACAYVIPKPGQEFTFEEMISFLKEKQIAPYKLPERIEIVDRFPMSGDGQKIMKKALSEEVTQKLRAEGKIGDDRK